MIKTRYSGVHYRIGKDGVKTFYISYKHNGRLKREKVGVAPKIDAKFCNALRSETLTNLRLGKSAPIQKNKATKTLKEVYEEYIEQLEARSKKNLKNVYDTHLKAYDKHDIMTIDADAIRRKKAKEISKRTKRVLSPKTVNNILALLSAILHFALREKYVDEVQPIKKQEVKNERQRYLTKDEVNLLYDEIKNSKVPEEKNLLLFTKIAITTGARIGAIIKIKYKEIDRKKQSVKVWDEKQKVKEQYDAYLTDVILEMIPDINSEDTIIAVTNIQQIQLPLQRILDRLFNMVLIKGKEEVTKDRVNKVVTHTLRHTFASHLVINGTPLYTVQKLMNHKTISMTARYAKLADDSGAAEVRKVFA